MSVQPPPRPAAEMARVVALDEARHQYEQTYEDMAQANGHATTRVNGKPADDEYERDWQPEEPAADDGIIRHFHRITVDLTAEVARTPLLVRGLYGAGCLTVLQSEPGVGKSWLALWLAVQVMEAGHDVVYLDEEGGLELVHERLVLLGAKPDLVAERFWYYAFEGRTWTEEDCNALVAMVARVPNLALAVFDSLPDFLAVADQDEDKARDVTRFIKRVCGVFRSVGCAQLLLDHLVKPPAASSDRKRSRYSRGSGSKLGKADATLLLETEDEFDDHTSGRLRLWKTKDRRGRLDLPALGKAGLCLDVVVGAGSVQIVMGAVTAALAEWDGPRECMRAVEAVLTQAPGVEFSGSKLRDAVRAAGHPFRSVTVDEAADRLATEGVVSRRFGPRGSRLYMLSPVTPQELPGGETSPWDDPDAPI